VNGEVDGLFARIDAAPERGRVGVVMVALGLMLPMKRFFNGKKAPFQAAIATSN